MAIRWGPPNDDELKATIVRVQSGPYNLNVCACGNSARSTNAKLEGFFHSTNWCIGNKYLILCQGVVYDLVPPCHTVAFDKMSTLNVTSFPLILLHPFSREWNTVLYIGWPGHIRLIPCATTATFTSFHISKCALLNAVGFPTRLVVTIEITPPVFFSFSYFFFFLCCCRTLCLIFLFLLWFGAGIFTRIFLNINYFENPVCF